MVVLVHGIFDPVAIQGNLSKFHGLAKIVIVATQAGWLGVQLFFVLSGFLITGILLDTKERPDYFRRFYWRRALRILPAYAALLLLLWILGIAQWPFLLASIFFISNFSALFGVALQYSPLWTLAVEEQFYLFWPQAVRRLSRKSLAIIAVLIVIITPIIRFIAFINNPTQDLYFYTWFVADGLALGALVALYLRVEKTTRKKVLYVSLALIMLGMGALIIGTPFGILHRYTLIGAIFQLVPWNILFAGIVMLTLVIGTGSWKRFVLLGWLRYFGYISYGLYLVHMLIFNKFDNMVQYLSPDINATFHQTFPGLLLRFVIAGGICVLVASLSRKYFENFFLRFKNKI
jgi:peptidoglycan/LPS O-acetylase OafA/YrhL